MSVTVTVTFGGTPTDVTSYAESVSISRGRPLRYGSFPAGTATITMNNRARTFDPLYKSGPYYGYIKPRIPISIAEDGISLFVGYVDDYDFNYPNSIDARTVFYCVDGLALLSQASLNSFTATQQVPGERITAVITRPEVDYPGDVDLGQGLAILQADTVTQNVNALAYLQQVAATDLGRLFVDRSGTLRYIPRTAEVAQGAKVVFASPTDPYVLQISTLSNATLWMDASRPEPLTNDQSNAALGAIQLQDATLWFDAGDPAYVPPIVAPRQVTVEYGTEELYNRAAINRLNGGTATSSDGASIIEYGTRTFTQNNTLFLDDSALQPYADFIVDSSSQPIFRITEHEIFLTGLDDIIVRYLNRLDVGDVVRTIWTPTQNGEAQDVLSVIERVTHIVEPGSHRMRVTLIPRTSGGFILDSETDGLLDTSEITY